MQIDFTQLYPLLIAIVLGAIVGLEREISRKSAGLGTNILICLGACVFTIASKEMGIFYEGSSTRIAAHIVGGVGFLGAGAIIQDRGGIQGITTAATIWLVASVGISCGIGLYLLACSATILTLITLLGLGPLEKRLQKKIKNKNQYQ